MALPRAAASHDAVTVLAIAVACWAVGASGGWLLPRRPIGALLGITVLVVLVLPLLPGGGGGTHR